MPSRIAAGFNYLDLSGAQIGVFMEPQKSNQTSASIKMTTTATTLHGIGCTWVGLQEHDPIQCGSFTMIPDEEEINCATVDFDEPFQVLPRVVVFLSSFKFGDSTDLRCEVSSTSITSKGFVAQLYQKAGTLQNVSIGWIAHPRGAVGISSGVSSVSRPLAETREAEFQTKHIDRAPRVMLALRGFHVDGVGRLRLKAKVKEIRKDGFSWSVEGDGGVSVAHISWLSIK